ncbi:restriction endonuclease [Streptomyces sp. KS 21]|uniref:restriction endonuclease n=1 Tax=Streptomyces sp. KS 21 TaxID=2485150 RepID=UPI001062D3AB|nr:restriction endonuclease [Streptomyces sp. KS 21]TDU73490.1 restriction endonuclease [Streptomyces sp. KS 21]
MSRTEFVFFSNAPAVNSLYGLEEALCTLRHKARAVLGVLSEYEMTAWYLPAELSPAARRRDLSLIRAVQVQEERLLSVVEDLRRGLRKILANDPHSRRRRDWATRLEQRFLDERPACPSWDSMDINPIKASLFDLEAEHSKVVRQRYEQLVDYGTMVVGLLDELLKAGIFTEPASLPMDRIDELHHSRFEKLIGDLMDRDGYRIVRSGGGAGDQGADVLAMDDLGRYLMVQCKHFRDGNGSVGQPVVQHLYGGAMTLHPSTLAIVVTNGRITGGAKVWAGENDKARLVGRDALKRWAEDGETLAKVIIR